MAHWLIKSNTESFRYGVKPATQAQLLAANKNQSFTREVYDPRKYLKDYNSRQQIGVEIAAAANIPVTLTASGELREASHQDEDARLTQALRGRTPKSQYQLNEWLKESDATLSEGQRMALMDAYMRQHHPSLPAFTRQEEEALADGRERARMLARTDREKTQHEIQQQLEQDESNERESDARDRHRRATESDRSRATVRHFVEAERGTPTLSETLAERIRRRLMDDEEARRDLLAGIDRLQRHETSRRGC